MLTRVRSSTTALSVAGRFGYDGDSDYDTTIFVECKKCELKMDGFDLEGITNSQGVLIHPIAEEKMAEKWNRRTY